MEILLILEGDLFRVVKGPGEGDLLLVLEGDLLRVVEGPGEAHLLFLLEGLQREDGDLSHP